MERNKEYDDFIDRVEAILACNPFEFPLTHQMTPGLYCRSAAMPAGMDGVSKIHKTEHFFMVAKGIARIAAENEGIIEVEAPFLQITTPGTRRIISAVTDVIWTTFHNVKYNYTNTEWLALTDEEKQVVLDEIEADIIEPHVNVLTTTETKEIQE